jgi:hypothetical protein
MSIWLNLKAIKYYLIKVGTAVLRQPNYYVEWNIPIVPSFKATLIRVCSVSFTFLQAWMQKSYWHFLAMTTALCQESKIVLHWFLDSAVVILSEWCHLTR